MSMVRRFDNRLLLIKIIPFTANNVPTGTVHYSDWHGSLFRLARFMMIPAGTGHDDSNWHYSWWFRLALVMMIPTGTVHEDSGWHCSGWFRLSLFRMIPTVAVQDDSDCHCEECSRSSADSNSSTVVRILLLFIFTFEKAPLAFMFIISKQCWWRYSKYTFVVRRNRICLALWWVEIENFQLCGE